MKNQMFHISFRTYFPNGNKCDHQEDMKLKDIPKWIECYKFTHKDCISITVKVWYTDIE